MDILLPAMGISVIVVFVFAVLASHWQQVLRKQSWTIRRLADRIRDLEEIGNPDFKRRLGESFPIPLEQVFTFSFRISERFWQHTLAITSEQRKFIQSYGSFVASVKLERWRSHTVATTTEILPESQAALRQTRTLDFYADSDAAADQLTLWELRLAGGERIERPPSLELILSGNSIELRGCYCCSKVNAANTNNGCPGGSDADATTFLRVHLDVDLLAEFRSHDPLEGSENGGQPSPGGGGVRTCWRAFYSHDDQDTGIEWQLWLHDLRKKADWDRCKILEPEPVWLNNAKG